MRVIITGGTGMIGRELAKAMKNDGHEVYVLTRNTRRAVVPEGVHVQEWDARTAEGWGSLVTAETAIVNFAGAGLADKRWTEERKEVILNSRIHAGEAVVQAVEQAEEKPRVVVQASAVGYYGPRGDEEVTEASSAGGDFLADVCKQWEDATAPVEKEGVRRVVTRSGVVLSTFGGAFPRMLQPFKFFVGGPIGGGEQFFPWIHIEDEVKAIQFLIENESASGVYNLTAPNPVNNLELTHTLGRVMKRPTIIPVPPFALQLLFGEMSTVLLDGQRVMPTNLREAGYEFQYENVEPALRQLLNK